MPTHLYLAPAGWGKTSYLLEQVHQLKANLSQPIRICVPSGLQAQAWKQRLADRKSVV